MKFADLADHLACERTTPQRRRATSVVITRTPHCNLERMSLLMQRALRPRDRSAFKPQRLGHDLLHLLGRVRDVLPDVLPKWKRETGFDSRGIPHREDQLRTGPGRTYVIVGYFESERARRVKVTKYRFNDLRQKRVHRRSVPNASPSNNGLRRASASSQPCLQSTFTGGSPFPTAGPGPSGPTCTAVPAVQSTLPL